MAGRFYFFIIIFAASHCIRAAAQDSARLRPDFTVSGFYYVVPDAPNTATFIATADYKN